MSEKKLSGTKLEIDFKRREGDENWDLLHNAHVLVNDRELYVSEVDVNLGAGKLTTAKLSIDVREFKRFLVEHADLTLEITQYGRSMILNSVRFIEGGPGTKVEIEGGPNE